MKLQSTLTAGIVTAVTIAIAPPVLAQPIPPIASNACITHTAEAMVVAARNIQVTGAGPVDALKGTRTLFMRNTVTGQTAQCKVNTIDGHILSVTLTNQPKPPSQTVPQASINACTQRTAEAMVVATRDIQMMGAGPANGLGERTLFMQNRVTNQTAECRVNTSSNTVLSVRLTSNPAAKPR